MLIADLLDWTRLAAERDFLLVLSERDGTRSTVYSDRLQQLADANADCHAYALVLTGSLSWRSDRRGLGTAAFYRSQGFPETAIADLAHLDGR